MKTKSCHNTKSDQYLTQHLENLSLAVRKKRFRRIFRVLFLLSKNNPLPEPSMNEGNIRAKRKKSRKIGGKPCANLSQP